MDQDMRPPGRARTLFTAAGALAATVLTLVGCTANGAASDAASSAAGPAQSATRAEVEGPAASSSPSTLPDGSTAATDDHPAKNVPNPELPAEVRDPSETGARAAARHFLATEQYLSLTGNGVPMLDIAPECDACKESVDERDRLYEAGAWTTGLYIKTEDVDADRWSRHHAYDVTLRVAYDSAKVRYDLQTQRSAEEQAELESAVDDVTSGRGSSRTEIDMVIPAYFDDERGHWTVLDTPTWYSDSPDALEGFNIKERG